MQNISQIKNILLFSLLVFVMALISLGEDYSEITVSGITLWANCVLPTLFPYLFLINLMNGLNLTDGIDRLLLPLGKKLFNVNGKVTVAYIISLLSGFPTGAKMIADLKNNGEISQAESVRASAFCSTPSPSFLISTVGGVFFHSIKIGLILFFACFITSFFTGILFSLYKRMDKPTFSSGKTTSKSTNLLYDSVYSSIISVLVTGGLITVFYLLLNVLLKFNLLSPVAKLFDLFIKDEKLSTAVSVGAIELTTGISRLSEIPLSVKSITLCGGLCGFGGLSVIIQSIAFLKSAKIKTAFFVFSKLINAVLNTFITFLLCVIFL